MAEDAVSQALDQDLVARVQRGDSAAFDLLVRKYQHRTAAVISRYIHDWAEVQDVAQDTFIRAYRAIGGVYLCGGVVRRLAPLIEPSAFRAIFEAKAPLSCLLQATPMHLITRDDPALLGLAAIAGGGGA